MSSDYYSQAQANLQAMEDEAKAWRRRAERADSPVMRQYYEEIQGIENKCDAARIALNACVVGGKNVSIEQQTALEKAIAAVREALDDLADRAKGVIGD